MTVFCYLINQFIPEGEVYVEQTTEPNCALLSVNNITPSSTDKQGLQLVHPEPEQDVQFVVTNVDKMFVRANLTILFTYVCLESLLVYLQLFFLTSAFCRPHNAFLLLGYTA